MSPAPITEADRLRPADRVVLGAILLAGLALRVFEASRGPMWFDEIYTTWAARGGFAKVLATMARDVHPPLHTLLVSAWVSLGGESTAWLRTLSILFGLATILVVFLLARAAFGRRAGLVAAALLSLHPVHTYFSQESRVYALLWLELAAAWWLAWSWIEGGRARDGWGYVAVTALALYTHYLAGLVLAFTAAGGLVLCFSSPGGRRRALEWIGLHLAVGVLFAPQLLTFVAQNGRLEAGHWIAPADARDLRDWMRHMAADSFPLILVFAALGALAFARREYRRPAAFLTWSSAVPVLLAWWLGSRGAHVFSARYMYFALPPLLVVVAGGFDTVAGRWGGRPGLAKFAPWALLVAVLAMEVRAAAWSQAPHEAKALAKASAWIREETRPGDVVYCADTHALLFLAHYQPGLKVRVVWFDRDLPYFEGGLVVADSLRCRPEDFVSAGSRGVRWWGVRVRRGGSNGPRAAAMFDSAAAGPPRRFDEAMVWGPK
jgi:4-amino-4-deoxy-L-arabinose transferase-like glycosyltransferase